MSEEKYSIEETYEIKKHEKEKKKRYASMAEHPPDPKASRDFHRPAYQAGNLIRAQGQQLWHGDVAEYLARKYGIGDGADGDETGRKQCEE